MRRSACIVVSGLAAVLALAAPAVAIDRDVGKPSFDIRDGQRVAVPLPQDPASVKGRMRLSDRLGREGVVNFDAQTNTPRVVAKLDGFLTDPSSDDPAKVALNYVRSQEAVFHLTAADIAALRLVRRYTDRGGTTHMVWAQVHQGIRAFDNDLHANVDAQGRLINVSGSPVADFAVRSTDPTLTAGEALAHALADAGGRSLVLGANPKGTPDRLTTFAGGHDARLVLFAERPGDTHLAWEVTANKSSQEIYDYVIDANTGAVLFRENTVSFASATLNVWEYAPNFQAFAAPGVIPARAGNQQLHSATIVGNSILVNGGSALDGPYAHVYPDRNSDNTPDGDIVASGGTSWSNAFVDVCPSPGWNFRCSWDGYNGASGDTNLHQNAAQVYYFVNNFHDWLASEPNIAFTAASGNFEATGADAVRAEVDDGSDTGPDGDHMNNANMATPADGSPPRMQMYLFGGTQYLNANGGDDASVIYHEYVHGLSNRLVTGGSGSGALHGFHARSMGEGWSDFYAMDYLVSQGLDEPDDPNKYSQMNVGYYVAAGNIHLLRTEGMDCPNNGLGHGPSDPAPAPFTDDQCQGGATPHLGGYGLGDMGQIIPQGPEYHADGETWAQTLWDLRQTLGAPKARRVITDGMRLSPPDPTMLDMRNAILQADQVAYGAADATAIWNVFRARQMGYTASVDDGNDTSPTPSTSAPPTNGVTISGRVTDGQSGAGLGGAYIVFDAGGAPGDYATTTNANGAFSLSGMQPATFSRVLVSAPGYGHLESANVTVGAGGASLNFQLNRNYAAAVSGASIAGFSPPDMSNYGCGAGGIIDGSLSSGWGSTSHNGNPPGAKSVVVKLAQATDLSGIAIDPGATCGDGDSASAGQYKVEVSSDGSSYSEVANATFGPSDNHRLNPIASSAPNVSYVRYTMLTPQRQSGTADSPDGKVSGAAFMDSTEIEIYGRPAPQGGTGPGGPSGPQQSPPTAGPSGPQQSPPAGGHSGPSRETTDTTAPVAVLAMVPKQKLRTMRATGLKVYVTCNETCSPKLKATLDAKTAKKLGLLSRRSRAKSVTVASGSLGMGSGRRVAKLKFTKAAQKQLKRLRSVKLTLAASITDRSGNTGSKSMTIMLKR
jgi:extracellular elastinolytic metalloproteinase